ncbi:MAG TPA: nucleoside deaminase [Candidatus Moranbacteria bacterium]|nr:nucleoside deaminase [Candidatus Moranbacteria bacterium]
MNDKDYLKLAVDQAKLSVEEGGFPAGAIVVKDGKTVSKGISIGFKLNDPTSHSETASIREACKILRTTDLGGATLYASVEPCMMCFSVANWAGISKIVYGFKKTEDMVKKGYYEGSNNLSELNQKNNRKIELKYLPDFEEEMKEIKKNWEEKNKL